MEKSKNGRKEKKEEREGLLSYYCMKDKLTQSTFLIPLSSQPDAKLIFIFERVVTGEKAEGDLSVRSPS